MTAQPNFNAVGIARFAADVDGQTFANAVTVGGWFFANGLTTSGGKVYAAVTGGVQVGNTFLPAGVYELTDAGAFVRQVAPLAGALGIATNPADGHLWVTTQPGSGHIFDVNPLTGATFDWFGRLLRVAHAAARGNTPRHRWPAMFRVQGMVIAATAPVGITGTAAGVQSPPTVDYCVGESKMTTPDRRPIRTSPFVGETGGEPGRASDRRTRVVGRGERRPGQGVRYGSGGHGKQVRGDGKAQSVRGGRRVELTDHGSSAKESFAGADGKTRLKVEESLTKISARTYGILYARLAPLEKRQRPRRTTPLHRTGAAPRPFRVPRCVSGPGR
jgi:hypothetical protein